MNKMYNFVKITILSGLMYYALLVLIVLGGAELKYDMHPLLMSLSFGLIVSSSFFISDFLTNIFFKSNKKLNEEEK